MKNNWRCSVIWVVFAISASVILGCDPYTFHRTVVVQSGAQDSSDALHLSGATVTLLCPGSERDSHLRLERNKATGILGQTDDSGELFYVAIGAGYSRECRVRIEKEGYQTREFPADEHCSRFLYNERHHWCRFGALYAELTPITD